MLYVVQIRRQLMAQTGFQHIVLWIVCYRCSTLPVFGLLYRTLSHLVVGMWLSFSCLISMMEVVQVL